MIRVLDIIIQGLRIVGMTATIMFVVGYIYGSFPLVVEKMCKQSWIDKVTQ